ncbi:MAG: nucleotidyltransferase family protein [Hyphomicrobiales bacterium]
MGAMEGMRTLNGASIPILLMKGAARIARDPTAAQERLIRDVDVLVPFKDKSRAFDMLSASGWGYKPSARWQDFWRGIDETSHHAWSFTKGNADIDLHHHSNHLNRLVGDDDLLWQRAKSLNWRGLPVFVPAASDNLLMSIVHGVRWSKEQAADWTIDASAAIDSGGVDWPAFVTEAKSRKVEAVAVSGLRYLSNALGKPIPADAIAELEDAVTPMQLSEMEHYVAAPMARDFPEAASAYSMSVERLSERRKTRVSESGAAEERQLRIEFPFVANAPCKIAIADLGDHAESPKIVVQLRSGLPSGTRLLGSVGIMGVLLDHAFAETRSGEQADGSCEFTFSVNLPLLRARGATAILFVAGVSGDATPLYWHREFKA